MKTLLESALFWLELQIACIPLLYRNKRPACEWQRYQRELPSRQQVERWFMHGFHNLGVVCGWSGLVVIDFDDVDSYFLWRRVCGDPIENSYTVQTARGMHVYVRCKQPVQTMHMICGDIKGQGGYVLGAPSVHPSGHVYTPLDPGAQVLEVDQLPASITNLIITPEHTEQPALAVPAMQTDPYESASQCRLSVDELRQRVRIESLFSQRWATSNDGRWWVTRCPFHDDRNPSMWIDVQLQIVGCYAGCTPKPLDVINLYSRLHHVSNHDAILALSSYYL